MLVKWTRRRLNGNIWIGKDQMVRLVREKDLKKLNKQIEMVQFEDLDPLTFYPFCYYFYLQEKKNSYAILKPYISPEEERIAMAARDTNEQKLEHLLFMCVQCTFSNLC